MTEQEIDAFVATHRGEVLRPGMDGYDAARKLYNGMIDKHPRIIARCTLVCSPVRPVAQPCRRSLPDSLVRLIRL